MVAVLLKGVENLAPAFVLPCQINPGQTALSPVQKLATAVLSGALQDLLVGLVSPPYSAKKRLGDEALAWVQSEEQEYLFSCESCCKLLGSSARDLRRIIAGQMAEVEGLRGRKRIAVHRIGYWRQMLGEAG